MPTPPSQLKWQKDNTLQISIRVNRNQDKELFELFSSCPGSKATLARELIEEALAARKAKQTDILDTKPSII